ncbi:MAG: trypsin-like peptidase domain-containing protein [Clostridia bacterium]|nr:trypsin-like peptidase domain-containing protein [Clostridia bacterium]
MSSPTSDVSRTPLPDMDKQPTLGKVTYTGSAGDNAYSTLAEAIDMVDETVVEIFTETIVSGGWLGNFVQDGAGSGVIISEDGYIVTNNHVISGAVTITVRMADGTTHEAQLVGTDASTDIAVLWVDTEQPLPAAALGCSADLIVGEYVYAIGNPLGSLGGTVTDGLIRATARSITVDGQQMTLLQTNAAVNPGNSGGGLFNMAGQLIGVVNAKYSENDVEGLGFAIPIDTAYDVICQLIEYGYVRGIVDTGLELYEITSSNVLVAWRYFGMSYAGLYVMESEFSNDVKYGDLLLSVNGVSVKNAADYKASLEGLSVGDTVTLVLIRCETEIKNGREVAVEREVTVELVLQEYVPEDASIRFEAK